ncbi:DNA primase [Tepiditoga spiralis]|uniref:DNA primase n=1 Tax=Tepiditoga spiralis TaxID=2108365 RepID=A0A7G1G399_9BACT|nr:DNA primase [Tepiditoga spiralis]BBE30888.1 DNA primase [Tepiditoga spiralis]
MKKYNDLKELTFELKEKLDIVDVISNYISVKKAGKNYTALCPFHAEDTPSFYIFPESKTYHCFGCKAHGDVINFIEKYEKIGFIEAVKKASKLAGIEFDFKEKKVSEEIKLNEEISKIYTEKLLNLSYKNKVWEYLKKRNINKDLVEEFEIGYSTGKEVENFLKSNLIDKDVAINAGLLNESREVFKNRLIIPIRDNNGLMAGFSGRLIENIDGPKYINTSENEYFKKSKILYLYYKNKEFIKQNDFAIIVEGYFDAISMYKYGFKNVVAVLGSTLTKNHAFDIMKLTKKIVTMFDNDDAGQRATISAIDTLQSKDFQIAVAKYKEKDPDELVKKYDKKYIAELLKDSYKFHEYIAETFLKKYDIKNDFGVEAYLKEMGIWYKKFNNAKRFEIANSFVKKISKEINKPEELIEKILNEISKTNNQMISEIKQNSKLIEKEIGYDLGKAFVYLWIKYPEYKKILKSFDATILSEQPLKEFLMYIKNDLDLSEILEQSSDKLSKIISEMWEKDLYIEPSEILFRIEKSFENLSLKNKILNLKEKLKTTKLPKERAEITSEIIAIYAKLKK